ncbi:TPA: superantigen-like protein SSL9 [Staphylococcus aureus]|uniref:Exotoxin 5 n=4 Tax=Bacteria TaxID=2 RepID=A0A229LTQ3_STAAU|nr:superantigen-like protein SSL9 [Staphylococcus aureus]HDH6210791.1 superantigen-like protein SSL9 [Staphylococcus aureus LTCF-12-55]HDH6225346.1 superantigen-like protein SSL9 [Staphylococcus aureus LTCF-12-46]HDH6264446.1 superantigen-like protein SSL9 [Staphylococcus aureus LTCF-7-30]HDH6421702.1 superantigen-like protein SSL9 [Staphylococcus aureus MRSA-Lux-33]HDH6424021.1 superantigen-like protein SSL9 [Staphylococcus aureus MRSA-Lux-34]HDH6427004.1 superantigen-like protein SSL9 [Stap
MKLTAIAKATLALGILTTGVMTAESQTVNAKVKLDETQRKYYINMLKDYYSQESYESTNISVKSEDYYGSNVLNFNQRNKNFKVFLIGDDRNKYKELTHGRDVFAVPELIDTKGGIYTVGGITKKNVRSVFGYVSHPGLQVKKVDPKDGFSIKELFFIQKEEVSLKELDFKIRKMLVEKYRLYKGTADKGRIVINMKDEKKHEIDLSEKLSFDRMFDMLDSKQIKNIEVNLN